MARELQPGAGGRESTVDVGELQLALFGNQRLAVPSSISENFGGERGPVALTLPAWGRRGLSATSSALELA
jgi:hypothetical protein